MEVLLILEVIFAGSGSVAEISVDVGVLWMMLIGELAGWFCWGWREFIAPLFMFGNWVN